MIQLKNDANPNAFITRKKSRVKIYQHNNVYFNDGETFEIELFNPKTNRVLCKIWLNGQEISGSGIIINPGQRIYLERFVDSNNKFVFKTYEVENKSESLDAIRRNGDVEIKFYNEYFPNTGGSLWFGSSSTGTIYNPINHPTWTYAGNQPSSISLNNMGYSNSITSLYYNGSLETGRIEKGEKTNQSFETSYGSFNYFTCSEVKYKIFPFSVKPIEGKDLKRYCTDCGKKLKETFKFCPNCGCKV